jgi:hypothetical protein
VLTAAARGPAANRPWRCAQRTGRVTAALHGQTRLAGAALKGRSQRRATNLVPCACPPAARAGTATKKGGKLGLGVKKLEAKVDDAIFDQVGSQVSGHS